MYAIYAKDGSEQAVLRTPLGAVRVVNLLTGMRPEEADPPTTAEEQETLLVRHGCWAAGYGYKIVKLDSAACARRAETDAGTVDPEALRVVLDAVADLGCISSVTVDEEAWKAVSRSVVVVGRNWRGVEVRLRQTLPALRGGCAGCGVPEENLCEEDCPTRGEGVGVRVPSYPGEPPPEPIGPRVAGSPGKLPQPSGEGGWLLRPLPGFGGHLTSFGRQAWRGQDGVWRNDSGWSRAPEGTRIALMLQWRGVECDDGLHQAERVLAVHEGREPAPSIVDLRKLWPTVADYARRCARPRAGKQEIVPFCEIVRVDNEGREQCGCCGAKQGEPCGSQCDTRGLP